MKQSEKHIDEAIRGFLSSVGRAFDPHTEIGQLPDELFELVDHDHSRLAQFRAIKSLSSRKQKLLRYHCEGHEPGAILESIQFDSPDQLWLELGESIQVIVGKPATGSGDALTPELKEQVVRTFESYDQLAERIALIQDQLEDESEKSKKRGTRLLTLVVLAAIFLGAFLIFYPKITRPDALSLYESYKSVYQLDVNYIDTTDIIGRDFYDAVDLFLEGELPAAAGLFETVSSAISKHTTEAYWYLVLINLHNGNIRGCIEYLELIRMSDPEFFGLYGVKLLRTLK